MKKILAVILLSGVVSASVMAMNKGDDNRFQNFKQNGKCEEFNKNDCFQPNSNITEEQRVQIDKIMKKYFIEMKKLKIENAEKKLVIDKLLLDENPDWAKIQKALEDESSTKVKIKMLRLKINFEIKSATGLDFPMHRFRNNELN